jgi:hypothetical protein
MSDEEPRGFELHESRSLIVVLRRSKQLHDCGSDLCITIDRSHSCFFSTNEIKCEPLFSEIPLVTLYSG